jgi:leucyl-tRNA synthetase
VFDCSPGQNAVLAFRHTLHQESRVPRYNPAEIEPRWQKYWDDQKTFRTPETVEGDKLYVLDMFPYPSGDGLHVGHPEGYTATDIVARQARMAGKSVLHPMGFDAFGLPAEEHAIKTNTPPRVSTERNIENFIRQLKMLGFSYDWDRQVSTTDIEYVRWTQWIFTVLFDTWYDTDQQKGRAISELPIPDDVKSDGDKAVREYQDEFRLAYQSYAPVNWCPKLGTVLANEEVIDGKSEVGGHPVERMPLRQWMLRITAYADRLESDLESVNWPEGIKKLQRDWIGRSTGAEVDFYIGSNDNVDAWKQIRAENGFPRKPEADVLRVYTTRPDTLYGATYMVIAPEHAAVESLTTSDQKSDVDAYVAAAASKSDRDRQDEKTKKTGVFTGSYAINPVNGKPVPIWIADYVLATYGTGAIMAVPAHDTRDFEFAKQFGLDVIPVVRPSDDQDIDADQLSAGEICFVGLGTAMNSGQFDGLPTNEFKQKITSQLSEQGVGSEAVNYKLRDWLFSRQRFWGEPFPILHELDEAGEKTGLLRAVDAADLPVDLPEIEDFKPHGRPEPPLEKADDAWLYPVIDGVKYQRETNTMPQWAGSCWYYLRFIDPKNDQVFIDPELEKQWMPVDLYIGGAEHAVLHLLYARFWHKVLFDRGHLQTAEPFHRLVNQGMILGDVEFTGYQTEGGDWVSVDQVSEDGERNPIDQSGDKLNPIKVDSEDVEKSEDEFVLKSDNAIRIDSRAYKMSKSRGNVVNPDDIVSNYGADSLRLYEMFMGPLEQSKPWSMKGVNGVRNFLDRVWRMLIDKDQEETVLHPAVVDVDPTDEQTRTLHKTIKAVTQDIETLSFNTAIARMMEFTNFFTRQDQRPKSIMESFVLLLSPFAPHIAEEIWKTLGHQQSLAHESWPEFDESLTVDSTVEIPVQIMGKIKSKIVVARGMSKDDLLAAAKADPKIQGLLEGKTIRKEIAVPDRLVNIVAN